MQCKDITKRVHLYPEHISCYFVEHSIHTSDRGHKYEQHSQADDKDSLLAVVEHLTFEPITADAHLVTAVLLMRLQLLGSRLDVLCCRFRAQACNLCGLPQYKLFMLCITPYTTITPLEGKFKFPLFRVIERKFSFFVAIIIIA